MKAAMLIACACLQVVCLPDALATTDVSLSALVEQKVEQSPMVGAAAQHAAAWQRRSRQWLARAPDVYASYRSDSLDASRDGYEAEAGVSLPLASPRGRQAASELGAIVEQRGAVDQALLRLQWSGRLREAYWNAREAAVQAGVAEEALTDVETLHHAVTRRVAAGDAAANDLLLTERAMASARTRVAASAANRAQAMQAWALISGLSGLPDWSAESQAQSFVEHPVLLAANLDIRRLRSELEWVRADTTNAPRLDVSWFREGTPGSRFRQDSTVLSLAVPIGRSQYNRPERAALLAALARAEYSRDQTQLQLSLARQEATSRLKSAEDTLPLLLSASDASQSYAERLKRAQELGQANLVDVIRATERMREDRADARIAEINRSRCVARYNQTLGVIQ